MALKTTPWDGSRYLNEVDSQRELLEDAVESGHAPYIAHALAMIARSRGIDEIAALTGISREKLYDALLAEEVVDIAVIKRVIERLGEGTRSAKDAA